MPELFLVAPSGSYILAVDVFQDCVYGCENPGPTSSPWTQRVVTAGAKPA